MEQHIKILAWIYIVFSGFMLLTGCALSATTIPVALSDAGTGETVTLMVIGVFAAVIFLIVSLPGLFGGYMLLKHRGIGRIVLLVVSALNLFNFPFGTALGVYGLWVLLKQETIDFLEAQNIESATM